MRNLAVRESQAVAETIRHGANRRRAACRLLDTAHHLRRAVRALRNLAPSRESDLVTLLRLRDRVEGVSRLVNDAMEDLKQVGVSRKAPIVELDGERVGFHQLSRGLREVRARLDAEYEAMAVRTQSEPGSDQNLPELESSRDKVVKTGSAIGGWMALAYVVGGWLAGLFNQEDDDRARTRISESSFDDIRRMTDNELVEMINAMLDGPTGDDDEEAILKILQAFDCQRRSHIVDRVGLDNLLDDIDGAEWDRLVNLLTDCGIIGIDRMDDDASRWFVNSRSDAQLGQLGMNAVRQLVINMFSGSCGDDDEDAILKLLRCQSSVRLHQLVAMPGTDVGSFDYNFDGDQWDDLEVLFAAHGIVLDP